MANSQAVVNQLANVIDGFHSDVNMQIQSVDNSTAQIQATAQKIFDSVNQFREDMMHGEEAQLAHENILRIEQVLKEQFGNHERVRRTIVGVVRDFDINLVRNSTITELSEELWITSSRYWLSYALIAVTAWVNDYPEVARNALAEALRRDPVKASLFYTLLNLRFNRGAVARQWFRIYVSSLDPTALQNEAAVMLEAYMAGLFGRDREIQSEINSVIDQWIAVINDDEAVAKDLISSYQAYLGNLQPLKRFEAPAIREFCTNASELETSYNNSEKYPVVRNLVESVAAADEVIQTDDNYRARTDAVLTSLISNYDAEELELRSQQEYYNLVIQNQGRTEVAREQHDEMLRLRGEGFNIGRQMVTWVLYPSDGVSPAVKKFALRNTKQWLAGALDNFSAMVRTTFPGSYRLKIDVWEGVSNGADLEELNVALRSFYEANKFSIMYINNLNMAALGALVLSIGLAFASLWWLVLTAAAIGYLVYSVMTTNKEYPARIEAAVAALNSTMAEIVEFRRHHEECDASREEIVTALNFL